MKKVITILVLMAVSAIAQARSGGINSTGCHIDHYTGIYHCH
jgi:hypothetical protein